MWNATASTALSFFVCCRLEICRGAHSVCGLQTRVKCGKRRWRTAPEQCILFGCSLSIEDNLALVPSQYSWERWQHIRNTTHDKRARYSIRQLGVRGHACKCKMGSSPDECRTAASNCSAVSLSLASGTAAVIIPTTAVDPWTKRTTKLVHSTVPRIVLCAPPEGTAKSLMRCADAMCAECNDVTCLLLAVNNGFKLPRVSPQMAETSAETEELIK